MFKSFVKKMNKQDLACITHKVDFTQKSNQAGKTFLRLKNTESTVLTIILGLRMS